MAVMDCDKLRPMLVDYVVGEFTPPTDEQEAIEKHLAECEACRSAAEELRGTGRALEAVKSFDTRLREEVRKSITSRARVEAQLVRATREHQRIAGEAKTKPVPLAAWLVLAVGTIGALALAALLPGMSVFSPKPVGRVVSCLGDALKDKLKKGDELCAGREIRVPEKCILCLKLTDGSLLDVAGPAVLRMGGDGQPMSFSEGMAYLVLRSDMALGLPPLKRLDVAAGSKVCLLADPVNEVAATVTVLSGSASYAASGGDGIVEGGKTLEVDGRSRNTKVRPLRETERPHWRKQLQVLQ